MLSQQAGVFGDRAVHNPPLPPQFQVGRPKVLRYRKQFVNTDWGQRDERVIQGNPRNQVNPRNDTSKTFSSFPHYYIWYPERN